VAFARSTSSGHQLIGAMIDADAQDPIGIAAQFRAQHQAALCAAGAGGEHDRVEVQAPALACSTNSSIAAT